MARSTEYGYEDSKYQADVDRAKLGLKFLTDLPEFPAAVKIVRDVYQLLDKISLSGHRDQLERASTSVVCNIAEAAGRGRPAQHLQYQLVAKGSLWEVIGLLAVCPVDPGDLVERCTKLARLIDETIVRVGGTLN